MAKERGLTGREKLFCLYFAKDRDARGAAARAGCRGEPEKAAAKLLAKPAVTQEIGRLCREEANQGEVRAGVRRLAFGPSADAVKLIFAGDTLGDEAIERLDLFSVSDIKRPKGGGVEIKFFDRLKALELLMKIESGQKSAEGNSFFAALSAGAAALARGDGEFGGV